MIKRIVSVVSIAALLVLSICVPAKAGAYSVNGNDSQWADVIMQKAGLSIGSSGCCLTSFAMVQKYYGGSDNPEQVNAVMGDDACSFQYYRAAERYGYTISALVMNTADGSKIKDPIGSADSGIVYLSSYTDNGYHVDNIVVYSN